MRDFFNRLLWKMQAFMSQRYGHDALSFAMMQMVLVLLIISLFWRSPWLTALANVLVIFALFRMLSKNIGARQQELAVYERMVQKARAFLNLQKRRWVDRKTYRYYRCKCGQVMRVPKGAGKIEIRCPSCGVRFIKKV